MMPRSDRDNELLSAYLDGALSPSDRAAFERRMDADSDLRADLEGLRAAKRLLAALPMLAAPRPFTLTAAQVRQPLLLRAAGSPLVTLASAAAAVILLVAGILLATAPVSTLDRAPVVALAVTTAPDPIRHPSVSSDEVDPLAQPNAEIDAIPADEMFSAGAGDRTDSAAALTATMLPAPMGAQAPQAAVPASPPMPQTMEGAQRALEADAGAAAVEESLAAAPSPIPTQQTTAAALIATQPLPMTPMPTLPRTAPPIPTMTSTPTPTVQTEAELNNPPPFTDTAQGIALVAVGAALALVALGSLMVRRRLGRGGK